jgi:hypothetical protein
MNSIDPFIAANMFYKNTANDMWDVSRRDSPRRQVVPNLLTHTCASGAQVKGIFLLKSTF